MLEKILKKCSKALKKVLSSLDANVLQGAASRNATNTREIEMKVFKEVATQLHKDGAGSAEAKKAAVEIAEVVAESVAAASKKVLNSKRRIEDVEEGSGIEEMPSKKQNRSPLPKRTLDEIYEETVSEFEKKSKRQHLDEKVEEILDMDVDDPGDPMDVD